MCKLVKFKAEHLEVMDLRGHESEILDHGFSKALEDSVSVTAVVDGRVLCCGGVSILPGGNADVWLIPSIHVSKHSKTFVMRLKKWLWGIRKDFQLTRMQTVCVNDELHNRWMSYLGFKKEGIMRKFHNGNDYAMYARVEWE